MAAIGTQRISTRATGVVGIAILCSRVLGLIREVVFAAMFGASRNMDAFLTAFRAPNMLRDLFAEGALSTAFVTTFSRRIATDGDRSAWDLASKVATLTLGAIPGGVPRCYLLDPQPDWRHPHFRERGLVGLSIATLVGGLLQLAVQLPSLRRVGFRFHPDFKWRDPGVRTILGMMGPAMIAASAVQVNVAVNSIFASGLGDGPIAWLNIAFRLMQLPLGIFGVAVATVTLPLVSRSAAVGNTEEFRSALAHSVRLVLLLTIPAAIGLIILAEPIIQLIYQHGRFTHEATIQTAAALRFYAIGLAGYSADKVLAPAFYALDKRHLPIFVSLASIAVNLLLNWFFTFHLHLGHRGRALSTSLVAVTNFFFLYSMMRHYTKRLETGAMLKTIGKLLVAGTVLVAICWLASGCFFMRYPNAPAWQNAMVMLVTICCGAGAFFSAAYLLRVTEVHDLVDLLQRRIGTGGSPEPPKGD